MIKLTLSHVERHKLLGEYLRKLGTTVIDCQLLRLKEEQIVGVKYIFQLTLWFLSPALLDKSSVWTGAARRATRWSCAASFTLCTGTK